MKALELSPKAQADLEDIWLYSLSQWGLAQADDYLAALRRIIEGLQDGRTPSRNADDVRHGYCMALAKRHVIVFRESLEKIEVIRVLHQRMDAGRWV